MGLLVQEPNFGNNGDVTIMRASLGIADLAVAYNMPTIPAGHIIRYIHVNVVTAFDSGASDGLEVGTAADPNRYVTTVDCQAVAQSSPVTGAAPTPLQLAVDELPQILITPAGAAATVGRVDVTFVIEQSNDV